MKIYEVFVTVHNYDSNGYTCYERLNGTLFANFEDAKAYMDKMYADKEANCSLIREHGSYAVEHYERRYVVPSDYTETEMSWRDFCIMRLDIDIDECERLAVIFEANRLVDDIKDNDAIILAVTYGGNKWYLRETELH